MGQEAIIISAEELEAAGGDPAKCPSLQAVIGTVADDAAEEFDTEHEESDRPEKADVMPSFNIMGRECRPFSAGVIMMLEDLRHPMMSSKGWANPKMRDVVGLLFLLLHPVEAELGDWIDDSTFYKRSRLWALELTPEVLTGAQEQMQAWVDSAVAQMKTDPDDPFQGKKKAATG